MELGPRIVVEYLERREDIGEILTLKIIIGMIC